MKKIIFLFFVLFSTLACGTAKKVSTIQHLQALPIGSSVDIIGIGQKLPENAKLVGQIKIGDKGMTVHCKYDQILSDAVNECRKLGANVFQITEHKEPSLTTSTCHQIKGDAYFVQK